MKIIEINIKCFGRLKDFVMAPGEGINVIYGKNESGKSTVMAFIKAMFYGLESGEKRRQFEPWNGGQPSGTIRFIHNETEYLLSRTFGDVKGYDKISLYDNTNKESVPLSPGQEPGALVFGINIKTFVSTVFIGQGSLSVDGENSEIIERLINLSSAGDEHISKNAIEKRLSKAAAQIDSKKIGAILPDLRKQKRELTEKRAEIQRVLAEADKLRQDISYDHKQIRVLREQKAYLEEMLNRLNKLEELREIEEILRKHDEVAELEKKYQKLDAVFSGTLADGMSEFMASSAKLMAEEKNKEAELQEKLDEQDDIRRQTATIDRSKLNMTDIVKRYSKEINVAFEQYDSLTKERKELERALDVQAEPKQEPEDFRMVIGVCAAVTVAALILGMAAHWIFFIFGLFAVIGIVVYIFIYKKGMDEDDIFNEIEVSLGEVNDQLSVLDDENRNILDAFGVRTMEEFDRLYKSIELTQRRYIEARDQSNRLDEEIKSLKAELEKIRERIRENLDAYCETESSEQAEGIISRLTAMKREHEQISIKLAAARDVYSFMLKNRNIDDLMIYADQLRNSVNLEVPASFTEENVKSRIAGTTEQLDEMKMKLSNEETALQLKPYSSQDVEAVSDEIKALNRRIRHYEFELSAINEAIVTLNEAFREMQIDFGPMINYRANRILSGITGEHSGTMLVSDKLMPTYAAQGDSQPRGCNQMGAGTYNQIYLSLRLALSGVITDEKLPVVLDDSFVQFDDDRMMNAFKFIKENIALGEIGQVILFTCQKRMISAAKKLEITDSVFSM
jgi:Uncharacterized conserved protein